MSGQNTQPLSDPTPISSQAPKTEHHASTHTHAHTGKKPDAKQAETTPKPLPPARPKLNIKDYQFKNCKGEVKLKAPG